MATAIVPGIVYGVAVKIVTQIKERLMFSLLVDVNMPLSVSGQYQAQDKHFWRPY